MLLFSFFFPMYIFYYNIYLIQAPQVYKIITKAPKVDLDFKKHIFTI